MLNYAETTSNSTIVSVASFPQDQHQEAPVSSYVIGPIDPAHLVPMHAHCSNGEHCPLLVPKSMPLWILNHPEFRDGYERNYFSEEEHEKDDKQWSAVPHMVNLIYSKLLGEGFGDLVTGVVEPSFGAWEIGWLLRDFTRLAATNQTLALTALAHLCFLVSFLPAEPPTSWPPVGLVRARGKHDYVVKAFRARVRVYSEQGKSYEEAQQLAVHER